MPTTTEGPVASLCYYGRIDGREVGLIPALPVQELPDGLTKYVMSFDGKWEEPAADALRLIAAAGGAVDALFDDSENNRWSYGSFLNSGVLEEDHRATILNSELGALRREVALLNSFREMLATASPDQLWATGILASLVAGDGESPAID